MHDKFIIRSETDKSISALKIKIWTSKFGSPKVIELLTASSKSSGKI
jgi:hypothetical protein